MKLQNRHIDAERIKRHGPRPPLRSLREFADEFGLTVKGLASLMARDTRAGVKIPERVLQHAHNGGSDSWYRPAEMRAWWATHQPKAALEPGPDPTVISWDTERADKPPREEHAS